MKKLKLQNKFLTELQKVPNVSIACERVGLARQTIYRWQEEDKVFKKLFDEALSIGIESICDLAESKLISHIKNGNLRAIEFYLNNNKKNYIKPRPKNMFDIPYQGVKKITYEIVDHAQVKKD